MLAPNTSFQIFSIILFIVFGNYCLHAQNVGLGTTSPQGEFHVSAPFIFQGVNFTGTGLNDLSSDHSGYVGVGSTNYAVIISNAGPNPNLFRWSDDGGSTWSAEIPMAGPLTITDGVIIEFANNFGHTYNDEWTFTIGESYLNGLVVKNAEVGIGTDSPTKKLDVAGDINYSGDLYKNGLIHPFIANLHDLPDAYHLGTNVVVGASGSPNGSNNTYLNAAANGAFGDNNTFLGHLTGSSNNNGYRNTFVGSEAGTGNFGGDNNLFVGYRAGYSTAASSSSGNTFLGTLSGNGNDGQGNVFIGYSTGGTLTNSNNKLMIANSNTLTPLIYGDFNSDYLLLNRTSRIVSQEVFGIHKEGGSYGGMYVNVSGSFPRPFYGFAVDGNSRAWLEFEENSDDVIVNNSYGNFRIQFNTATKPVAGSWVANSDSRLKKNIKTLDQQEMLNKVLGMRGVSYEWNDDKTSFERPLGQQIGFIAQELQKIWPEKISTDRQGYLQTAYGDYDPMFVEAIKALNEMLGQQAIEIDQLKRKIEALENAAVSAR